MLNYLRYLKKIKKIIPDKLSKKNSTKFFFYTINWWNFRAFSIINPFNYFFLNDDLNKIPFISKYFELANYNYQELIIFNIYIFFVFFKSVYLKYYIQKFWIKTELTLKIFYI